MREQNNLCAAIRGPPHKLLQVVCNDSMAWYNSEHTVPVIKDRSRLPLLQLLEGRNRTTSTTSTTPHLSKKKKKVIVVILANFLMTLLGSCWLQKHWTSENIFFVSDHSEPYGLEMPYILSSLENASEETTVTDIASYYSSVYAFGILILELELDQSIPIATEDEDGADEEYPAVYMALVRVFQLRKEDLDDPYVLQVINSCLDFVNKVESIQHPSFNDEKKFDAAVLRFILEPLIQRLRAAHPEVSLDLLGVPMSSLAQISSPSGDIKPSSSRSSGQATASVDVPNVAIPATVGRDSSRKRPSSFLSSAVDPTQPRHRRDFKIAIICALPLEADAVMATFDKRWDEHSNPFGKTPGDPNAYSTGRLGRHNVVLVHMPGIGKENAASAAANCRSSFGGIELAVVVGVCAGVPFPPQGEEILLGDVVISEGIISYDFGRQYPHKFVRKKTVLDSYGRPNPEIRALLARTKTHQNCKILQDKMVEYLRSFPPGRGNTTYPGRDRDMLFESAYRHKHHIPFRCATCDACSKKIDPVCEATLNATCEELGCDSARLVSRQRLSQSMGTNPSEQKPLVHFGLFATGDIVMKSGEDRDAIAAEEKVIAFEMEGAGVWETFPCLVIKGVCDYADSHKSKSWQNFAATTAAACTKAFLENWVSSCSES